MKKNIKYSKRCKDKALVGKVKEVINQVSHSKKWLSQKATYNFGNPLYDKKGISADRTIKNLKTRVNNLVESVYSWIQKFEKLQEKTKHFMVAIRIAPQKVTNFLKDIIIREDER